MKAKTRELRHKTLSHIGGKCKAWRISHGLRLCDICDYGLSVQSVSNFVYGFNDSALALMSYIKRGFREV